MAETSSRMILCDVMIRVSGAWAKMSWIRAGGGALCCGLECSTKGDRGQEAPIRTYWTQSSPIEGGKKKSEKSTQAFPQISDDICGLRIEAQPASTTERK